LEREASEPEKPSLDFQGVTEEPKRKKGRPPIPAISARQRKSQAQQTADVLLTITDGMTATLIGPDCVMLSNEREMIEPPLSRILERLDPLASALIEKYTDPILLTMGLAMWGLRIFQVQSAKMEEKKKTPPNKLTPQPVSPSEQVVDKGNGFAAVQTGNLGDSPFAETLAELGQ
jgi:hypothetical protein